MKYTDARDKIKTGDMLLWRNHGGGPLRGIIERWIVAHGTATPYTHVGVAWAEHGRVWVMEITTKGCAPRLLSELGSFDWAPCPQPLTNAALEWAFGCFGEWEYSRWQAMLGALKRLVIGADNFGQCAEYALSIWARDGMAPTDTATPGACAEGAMRVWDVPITWVESARFLSQEVST